MNTYFTSSHEKQNIVSWIWLDLLEKRFYHFGFASASLSFLIDLFSNTQHLGSVVGILISAGMGFFSIMKARESWLRDQDERLHQKRLREDAAYRKQFLESEEKTTTTV